MDESTEIIWAIIVIYATLGALWLTLENRSFAKWWKSQHYMPGLSSVQYWIATVLLYCISWLLITVLSGLMIFYLRDSQSWW